MPLLVRLLASLWLGSGAFLIAVAAPAAFRASDGPVNAANVVGAMLDRWHYVALALPLALLLLTVRRSRHTLTVVLFLAVVFAAAQTGVDLRIRSMRSASAVPISSLPRQHQVRRTFGMLHGVSSLLLLLQVAAAGVVVGMGDEPGHEARVPGTR